MRVKQLCSFGAIAIALLTSPIAAHAQFSLGIGRSFPMGDFSDEAKAGWAGQVSYGFQPGTLPFRLRTDVLYQDHKNVEREPSLYTRVGGEWFRQLGLTVNATHELPLGAIEPYGMLGVGVIREWHGDYSHSGTDQMNFRLNAGVGLNVPIGGGDGGLFIEVRPLLLGKSLPLTRPAVHEEVQFQTIPIMVGFRL